MNIALVLFFSIILLGVIGGWSFINSDQFSKDLSTKVSSIITEKFGSNVNFSKVDFIAFPPKAQIHNLEFEKVIHEQSQSHFPGRVKLKAELVNVEFGLSNLLSRVLIINNVNFHRGELSIESWEKNPHPIKLESINLKNVFDEYLNSLFSESRITVEKVKISDFKIKYNEIVSELDLVDVFLGKKSLRSKFLVKNIQLCRDQRKVCREQYATGKKEVLRSLSGNGVFERTQLVLKNLKFTSDYGEGEGFFEVLFAEGQMNQKPQHKLNSEMVFQIKLNSISNVINEFLPDIKPIDGLGQTSLKLFGLLTDPRLHADFVFSNFSSHWIDGEEIKGTVLLSERDVTLKKLTLKDKGERLEVLNPARFFSFQSMWFIPGEYFGVVHKLSSQNFLQSVPSLNPLKTQLSGQFQIKYTGDNVVLASELLKLNSLELSYPKSTPILKNQEMFSLIKSEMIIDKKFDLDIKTTLSDRKNKMQIAGKINSEGMGIKIFEGSTLDWKNIGPISGVPLTGEGPISGFIEGPLDHILFKVQANWKNFEVVDLHLGNVQGDIVFDLAELKLNFMNLEGLTGKNKYNGFGFLQFDKDPKMDLLIQIHEGDYYSFVKALPLIFKNVPMPDFVNFQFQSQVSIKGGYDLEKLLVEGNVKGKNISIYDESFDGLQFQFNLKNQFFNIQSLVLNKFKSQWNLDAKINLDSGFIDFSGESTPVNLTDFDVYRKLKFGYLGNLKMEYSGNGVPENLGVRVKFLVSDTTIANVSAPPSQATLYYNGKEAAFNGKLLDGQVKFETRYNLNSEMGYGSLQVQSQDLNMLLGAFSSHNFLKNKIIGKINADVKSEYDFKNFSIQNIQLNVKDFEVQKDAAFLKIDHNKSRAIYDKNKNNFWELKFIGNGQSFVNFNGQKNSSGVFVLGNRFKVDGSFLEFLSPSIEKITGFANGESELIMDKSIRFDNFNVVGDDFFVKIKEMKIPFTNVSFQITKDREDFNVNYVKGEFGDGDIRLGGKVGFQGIFPQVNLNYQIEKVTMPLFKKSLITVNGSGEIMGREMPYMIKGKLLALHGEFLDDPQDFEVDSKVNIGHYKVYLPNEKKDLGNNLFELNLQYETVNPILIKNNLAEIYLKSSGQVLGDYLSPELMVRVEALPNISKFKFKGNDFNLSSGSLEIKDQGKVRNSDLRFIGLSRLNDYDLKIEISGRLDKINFNLSSDPPLSQDDLFSLLTLGVTSDISKNLDQEERKFVTTVGIGTLLFDQFKINQDLNSSLGLKLSVLPEFKENETQLIQGKSAVSDGSSSKLKSSTKIKVDKKLTKKIDVSVSSTVGGSLEPKQEMNLNYNLNKNWSVEGVYELKSTETEDGENSNSLGADLKYKWSF